MERTQEQQVYRGRIAPTPSGHLHVGHAQTFWIAQKRARSHSGGAIFLRIEDIDVVRCKQHFLNDLIEDLKWFGINLWEDSIFMASTLCPVGWVAGFSMAIQSRRLELYHRAWFSLYTKGFIYPCKLSRRDVETALSAPHDNDSTSASDTAERVFPAALRPTYMQGLADLDLPFSTELFPPEYRNMVSPLSYSDGSPAPAVNWRFRVPMGDMVRFADGLCGPRSYTAGIHFGDFLIWRVDGYPSYELAVVVDDVDMGITEVVRGEDLLLSTARQILLQNALHNASTDNSRGISYFHVPLLRDENGIRLAKRALSKSLRKLREEGFSPEEIRERFFDKSIEHLWKDDI